MNTAIPYVISYAAVGVILGAAAISRGPIARSNTLIVFLVVAALWPLIVFATPDILFASKAASKGRPSTNPTHKKLAELARSDIPTLGADERQCLTKVAMRSPSEMTLFADHSDFAAILRDFWDSNIPPEVYWSLKTAISRLEDHDDLGGRLLYSRLAPKAPNWYVGFSPEFVKSIAKVDRNKQGRILEAIGKISIAPVNVQGDTIKPLTSEMAGLWRYRLGDDRLLYYPDVDNKKVMLISFSPRGSAYKS